MYGKRRKRVERREEKGERRIREEKREGRRRE